MDLSTWKKGPNGWFRVFLGMKYYPVMWGLCIVNHFKDPYYTTSIMVAQMLLLGPYNNLKPALVLPWCG